MKKKSYSKAKKSSKNPAQKKVKVAKGVKVSKEKKNKLEKKEGSSNTGKYKNVSPQDFAGKAGGASPYSYPINTKARAKSALKLAHNAPDEKGIKEAVYKRYPELKPKKKK